MDVGSLPLSLDSVPFDGLDRLGVDLLDEPLLSAPLLDGYHSPDSAFSCSDDASFHSSSSPLDDGFPSGPEFLSFVDSKSSLTLPVPLTPLPPLPQPHVILSSNPPPQLSVPPPPPPPPPHQRPSIVSPMDDKEADRPKKRARSTSKKLDMSKGEQTEEERREMKRQLRLIRNRVSAQQSRERKKQHVVLLENKVQAILDSNKALQARVAELTEENAQLRKKLLSAGFLESPNTPTSPPTDTDLPDRRQSASPPGIKSAGVVMLALFFSFGLFYSFAGLNFVTNMHYSEPIEAFSTGHHMTRALLTAPSESDSVSLKAPLSSLVVAEQPRTSSLGRLAVQIPRDKASTAIAPTGRVSVPVRISTREEDPAEEARSFAVDIYQHNQKNIHQSLMDAMHMYKKMLEQSNSSLADTNSSIMFCPSAIHIEPRMFSKRNDPDHNKVLVSHDDVEEEERVFDPRNMIVWVPSKSILPTWGASFNNTDSTWPGRPTGVTELAVKVNSVRPITEAGDL